MGGRRPGSIAGMTFVISTNMDPSGITRSVLSAIRSVDPSQPVFGVKTMEIVVSEALSSQRLYAWLLGVFAMLALTLASAGIYGVMSYQVAAHVKPIDPSTFAAVSVTLTRVVLLATYLPALRATRVDPMVALRYE